MMHLQPSNDCPTHGCDLQQMPPPKVPICGRDVKNFVTFSIAHLERFFHLEHIDFKD
jgi:hypothetical protein